MCVCVLPCTCMHRGIEGDSQEKGYLLHGPGDLSVLTSSPGRLRCSRWRLPERAEIDGEHGGPQRPCRILSRAHRYWPALLLADSSFPLLISLVTPFSIFFFFSPDFSLSLRCAFWIFLFSFCHFATILHPCFLVSLSHHHPPFPRRHCLSRFGCHETVGVSALYV